jgi:hypothetical protein
MQHIFVRMLNFLSEKGDKSLYKSTYCICYSEMAAGILS